jgi:hypothetical protein
MNRLMHGFILAVTMSALSACYVVPMRGTDGNVYYETYPLPPVGTPIPPAPSGAGQMPGSPLPAVLNARLYPSNDVAAASGVITGTVTNMMTGKGRFQINYLGEVMTGEATRVSNDDKRGIASAYGSKGTVMSCDYQLTTPYQGTGDCRFSNGATYTLHLGGN